MKILFLAINVRISDNTGDAVHVRELAMSLAKLGNDVSLIVPSFQGESDEIKALQEQDNLSLFFIKRNKFLPKLSSIVFLRKVARSQDSEIIYERRFAPTFGFALNRLLKIPYAVEINGLEDKERQMLNISSGGGIIPWSIKRRLWRHLFNPVGRIIVVSNGLEKTLSEEYGLNRNKITVINNGANTDLFRPMDKNKCIKELGFNQKYRYVGFVGNLAPWQGVEQIIKIVPKIIHRFPETRFVIVGDGDMRTDLEDLAEKLGIRNKVIFTGFVPYKKVPKYINSFEICTAPFSGVERNRKNLVSPIKLYEYMACGKPVVTTDVCVFKNEMEDLELGLIVKADDTEAFTSSLVKLMENQDLQRSMGEKARLWVLNEHSWNKVAERVSMVCNNLAAASN
jgi:glycosyltransferase involved in cell wall biosynthesis